MPQTAQLRYASDWRSSRIPRRYFWSGILTPNAATANTILFGVTKAATTDPDVYISRIRLHVFNSAAVVATPFGWKRATTVAAGSAVTAADIPKCDTACPTASLVLRTGAVTAASRAAQYILTHPAQIVVAASLGGGIIDDWTARDLSERVRLTGVEGLTLEFVNTGDVDIRAHLLLVWEEVTN